MAGVRRGVTFSKVVEKHDACEISTDDFADVYDSFTDDELQERREEVRRERRQIRECRKKVDSLLALGRAAMLRAEIEPYVHEAVGRSAGLGSVPHQAPHGRDVTLKEIQSPDAEDVESFLDRERMFLEVEMCMKDICAGITESIVQPRAASFPEAWNALGADTLRGGDVDGPLDLCVSGGTCTSSGPDGWTLGKERAQTGTLPPIVSHSAVMSTMSPTKPGTKAPGYSRPLPAPPARKRPASEEMEKCMSDHTRNGSV
eukprot:TRINITY_DN75486_c0_g1_i1.p1 TRINITY_DN75486_c0_g1~~TRINITY_DN75486_c0_g1_i1.p1  ORF type:complete len:259 (+),score=37.75 TRINITY_DN75486_c0_g1_i1:70-846(+)